MTKAKILAWLAEDHGPVGFENWARFAVIAAVGGYSGVAALRISIWMAALSFALAVALPVFCLVFAAAQRIARKYQPINPPKENHE